jgi:hypothetical protein
MAATNFFTSAASFGNPKLSNMTVLSGIKTFDQTVGEESARLAGEGKRGFRNLLNGQAHGPKVPC